MLAPSSFQTWVERKRRDPLTTLSWCWKREERINSPWRRSSDWKDSPRWGLLLLGHEQPSQKWGRLKELRIRDMGSIGWRPIYIEVYRKVELNINNSCNVAHSSLRGPGREYQSGRINNMKLNILFPGPTRKGKQERRMVIKPFILMIKGLVGSPDKQRREGQGIIHNRAPLRFQQ